MAQLNFDIEKRVQRAAFLLFVGFLGLALALAVHYSLFSEGVDFQVSLRKEERTVCPCVIPLDLKEENIPFPFPNLQSELSFCLTPPSPYAVEGGKDLCVLRVKQSGKFRKIALPARVDFRYEKGLQFAGAEGSFWADFSKVSRDTVKVSVCVADCQRGVEETTSFFLKAEEEPLCTEFSETSPFRVLSEARWVGKDLFLSKYGEGVKDVKWRLEIGPSAKAEIVSFQVGDFFSWEDGKWVRGLLQGAKRPIVQVVGVDEKMVLFQGWIESEYVRFSLPCQPPPLQKVRGEEFISAVRIRSEKQISCMLDKQCFVLRVGDWILKSDNRWKVLRRKEEKDAYAQGKIEGDLFVFDRIEMKGGQKTMVGSLFNLGRSQLLPIEVSLGAHHLEAPRGGKRKVR